MLTVITVDVVSRQAFGTWLLLFLGKYLIPDSTVSVSGQAFGTWLLLFLGKHLLPGCYCFCFRAGIWYLIVAVSEQAFGTRLHCVCFWAGIQYLAATVSVSREAFGTWLLLFLGRRLVPESNCCCFWLVCSYLQQNHPLTRRLKLVSRCERIFIFLYVLLSIKL